MDLTVISSIISLYFNTQTLQLKLSKLVAQKGQLRIYIFQLLQTPMSFFGKLKQAFVGGGKEAPKFKTYSASQLKMIAMKTRLILQKHMSQLFQQITKQDQNFKYAGQDAQKTYNILQAIGEKVIQAESIKILIEMMRKIQNYSAQIIQTNGDIAHLKRQVQWFQCVLWYRQSSQLSNLDDLYNFCYEFFKGVDITTQLNVHCQVFQLYPILKYLPKKGKPIPLKQLIPYIQPYVSCNIDQPTYDLVLQINQNQIKQKGEGDVPGPQNLQNMVHPGVSQAQQPKSNIYTPYSPPSQGNYRHSENSNPYQGNNFYRPQQGNIGNYQPQHPYNGPYNQQTYNNNNNYNPYAGYQNQYGSHQNPYPQNNNNNFSQYNPNNNKNNYSPRSPVSPPNNQNQSNHYLGNANNNTFNQNNQQTPSNIMPPSQQPYNPQQNTLNHNPNQQTNQSQQQSPPKKSFYGSLMRNYERQPVQREAQEEYGSNVYRQKEETGEKFQPNSYEQMMKELDQIQKKESEKSAGKSKQTEEQEQKLKEEQERKQREQQQRKGREEREEQERKQKEEREEKQRKEIEEQERKEQQQKARKQAEQRQQRELQQQKKRQQEQKRLQQQRRLKEERQRQEQAARKKQQEQQARERQQDQRQRQWAESRREREQERDNDIQLNVFQDNERQAVDRGTSGRFSTNFGMKVDFGQQRQEEDFAYESPGQIQNSLLKFKKDSNAPPEQESSQAITNDQAESLSIIKQNENCEPSTDFKLFYFKKTQASS